MSISYPLSLPAALSPVDGELEVCPVVGISRSPFTGSTQTYSWFEYWLAQFSMPPMYAAEAEEWIAFKIALNGLEGSFLMGPPSYAGARGTWSGQSPLVNAAHVAGLKTLAIDGLTAASTGAAGDYFQVGTGSTSRLHKVTKAFTANGSGQATLDFTPRLRASLLDNAVVTLASPKGLWMLQGNDGKWSLREAMMYGIEFAVMEDMRGL